LKPFIVSMVALFSVISAHAYSSLEALQEDMAQKELEALKAYVEANPGNEDADEARQMLVYRLMAAQEFDEALAHLKAIYAALPEDKSGVELDVAGEVVFATLQVYQATGQTNEMFAFIEQVRGDFKNHEESEMIQASLDEFVQEMSIDRPSPGETMDISFTAIDGREISLSSMTGQVVLVDFWATWCGPCIHAMPALKKLYEEYQSKGFEIIGISLDNDEQKLDEYIKQEGIAWPQYFDGKGWENELAVRFGIDSIPSTYLIGKDGTIEAINATEEELAELVARLTGSSPVEPESP